MFRCPSSLMWSLGSYWFGTMLETKQLIVMTNFPPSNLHVQTDMRSVHCRWALNLIGLSHNMCVFINTYNIRKCNKPIIIKLVNYILYIYFFTKFIFLLHYLKFFLIKTSSSQLYFYLFYSATVSKSLSFWFHNFLFFFNVCHSFLLFAIIFNVHLFYSVLNVLN